MQPLFNLTAFASVTLMVIPVLAAEDTTHAWHFDLAVRSTVGVNEMSFENQRWVPGADGYGYDKSATHTSRIETTFGPKAILSLNRYALVAEAEFGNYGFSDSGTSSFRSAQLDFGWSPADFKSRIQGMFSIGYRWSRTGPEGLDTLFSTQTTHTIQIGMMLGSKRDAALRWQFQCSVPGLIFSHLFSWKDVAEHDISASGELTFGYKPHGSHISFDAGYHFWVSDHVVEVRHRDIVKGILSVRHGLVIRIAYHR